MPTSLCALSWQRLVSAGNFPPITSAQVTDYVGEDGAVVRLADGHWHAVRAYRVLDQGEKFEQPATPHAECYVEEIRLRGDPGRAWNF